MPMTICHFFKPAVQFSTLFLVGKLNFLSRLQFVDDIGLLLKLFSGNKSEELASLAVVVLAAAAMYRNVPCYVLCSWLNYSSNYSIFYTSFVAEW